MKGVHMAHYQSIIIQAMIFFPFIALLFSLPYILHNYHKYGSFLSIRIAIVYSFILYLLCMYFLVILPLPSFDEVAQMATQKPQLIPFQFMSDLLATLTITHFDITSLLKALNTPALYQVVFNLLMTIPFGMYLRYYFRCNFKKTLLFAFLLSLFFELTQLSGLYFIYPKSYRLFDVDDLLINTLGALLGYFIIKPFMRVLPTREEIDSASYKRGKHVSLPRRCIALVLDYIVILIINAICINILASFSIHYSHTLSIITIIYFIALAFLTDGQSIGKKIMQIKIIKEGNKKWYSFIIRYLSLYLMIDVIPSLLSRYTTNLYDKNILQLNSYFLITGLIMASVIIYLLFALVEIATHKQLFYERSSKTRIISTIHIEEENRPIQENRDTQLDSEQNSSSSTQ
ncbi:MAG: hypothetical protein EOM50_02830 [Erysipelotrichia bacterium]|nr:hypothetical protein [Erysipelotrichia bacterium]NCC54020.1 hypothetical protein [Erysipelotrichia bacterium]